jgi:hypothetical protein
MGATGLATPLRLLAACVFGTCGTIVATAPAHAHPARAGAPAALPPDPVLVRDVERQSQHHGLALHLAAADSTAPQLPPDELPLQPIQPPPLTFHAAPQGSTGRLHERVGPNGQPVWTTHRRFATTRAYVSAPWQVEFESWWEGKFRKDDTERHRYFEEVSIGLPGRFQLDFYWRIQDETGEETRWEDFQVEARWALAPWDCIPLNPTIYAEYKFLEGDEPEAWEVKLLLADDIGRRMQGALNLFFERQTSGEEEVEWGLAAGLSYALADPCLSVGVEVKYENVTAEGSRDDPEEEVLLGPSIQWRPCRGVHLDVAPLFGLTDDSPDMQVWVVLGIDLWPGTSRHATAPTSVRTR